MSLARRERTTTSVSFLRVCTRQPSNFTSCRHWGPDGGVGRHTGEAGATKDGIGFFKGGLGGRASVYATRIAHLRGRAEVFSFWLAANPRQCFVRSRKKIAPDLRT